MKRIVTIILSSLAILSTYAQAWVTDEMADEARDSSHDFGTMVLGAFVLAVIIGIIYIINAYYKDKIKAKERKQREIAEKERKERWEKEYAIEQKKKNDFLKSLQCPNIVEIDGFKAVDLGLGDKYATLYWGVENLGSENQFECGRIYGWGMSTPAIKQSMYGLEDTLLRNKEYEEFDAISGDGSYKGEREYDAVTAKMGGLWFTPTADEFSLILKKCSWEFIDKYGVLGWKITGVNGNFIFLPLKKDEDTFYITSSANEDDSISGVCEIGKSKYGYFIEVAKRDKKIDLPEVIKRMRLNTGLLRPTSYGERKNLINAITEYEW